MTKASRGLLGVLAALPLLGGCTQDFWDRSPRVAGLIVRVPGPLLDANGLPLNGNAIPPLASDSTLTGDPDGAPAPSRYAGPARGAPLAGADDLAALAEVNRLRAQQGPAESGASSGV